MVKPKGKTSKKRAQKSSKTKTTRAKNKKLVQEIDKSQQLLHLVRTRKSPRTKAKRSIKVDEFVAGCNKKMPSLSVLEQKYEDSDSDEEKTVIINKPTEQKDNPSSPIISPATLEKYADKCLQIFNNFEAPPPVIPMKMHPKSEVPYIVGCKDSSKVPETRSVNFCKGEADYGISSKTNGLNVEQDCLKLRDCHVNVYSLSKSNFNSQANEIASKLMSTDNIECIDSDSDDTVVYEINSPKARFSPRPSTSKDNETITKNDQNFNESFMNNKFHAYIDIQNASCRPESKINAPVNKATVKFSPISNNLDDIEIIENTFEAVSNIKDEVLDIDSDVEIKQNENNVSHINVEINKTKTVVQIRDNVADYNTEVLHVEGNTIELKDNNKVNFDITKDNFISIYDDKQTTIHDTIDVSKISPINTDNSTTMNTEYSTFDPLIVIDLTNIDDLILENKAVIDKYSKHNFKTVKVVESKDMKNQTVQSINSHHPNTNCNNNPDILEVSSFSSSNKGRTVNSVFNNPQMENMPMMVDKPSTVKNPTSMKDKCTNNMNFTMYENSTLNPTITAVIDLSKMDEDSHKPINSPQIKTISRMSTGGMRIVETKISPSSSKKSLTSNSANNVNQSTNSSSNMSSKPFLGTCPICLDNMSKETVGSTHCGHLFCMPCIKVALQKKPKQCPTCRKKLTGTGWHQIFI